MRYVLAIAMTAALALGASGAVAASKKHPRYNRHSPGAAVKYSRGYAIGPHGRTYRCLQDEGYGRVTICGQGR
jgi:hypothetical protein